MNISTKILLTSIISISLIIGSSIIITYFNNVELRNGFMREHKASVYYEVEQQLKNIVGIAYEITDSTITNQKKQGATQEYMEEVLRKRFADDLRFFEDKSGYVFMYKSDGTTFAMPGRKNVGKNMIDMKDSNGKYFLKELINKAIDGGGGGMTRYEFPKPGSTKPEPKMAYSMYYKDLDLMLGVGIYVDYVDNDIAKLEKEIQEDTEKELYKTIGYLLLLMFISIVSTYFIIRKSLIIPLKDIVRNSNELSSGNGDLTKHLPVKGKDEIAVLSSSINAFIDKVHSTVKNAKELSNENSSISNELSSTSLQVGKAVQSSMEIIQDITSNTNRISSDVTDKTNTANDEMKILVQTQESLESTVSKLNEITKSIQNVSSKESEIASNITVLSTDAKKISEIIDVIDDIADQTNLLALNAAVESARSGEHGRGFAVISDEIRKLAEKTQQSLSDIQVNIKIVLDGIDKSSKEILISSKAVISLSEEAKELSENMESLKQNIQKVQDSSKRIIMDFSNTGNQVQDISKSIQSVNTLSSENARSVEEIASASEHLNRMTEQLQLKLQEFKT